MNVSLVPTEHVFSIWSQIRDYLEPAVATSKGRWTMEHLCASVTGGRTQVWIAFDEEAIQGVVTTEVVQYPAKKVLAMHFLGGQEFDNWYPEMLRNLTRYSLDMGCDGIEGVARFGFWKYLKADGFEKTSAFYEKGLH